MKIAKAPQGWGVDSKTVRKPQTALFALLKVVTLMVSLVVSPRPGLADIEKADVEEVSVRLRTLNGKNGVSISGEDVTLGDTLRIAGFSKIQVRRKLVAGDDVWIVSDFITEKTLAQFTSRKLDVRGQFLRVDLRVAPPHVQIVPSLVPRDSKLQLVGLLGIEDYLQGVVSGEVPRDWPEEALKAQSVAARSFVIAKVRERRAARPDWLVEATVMDQVFDFEKNHSRAAEAVRATAGEVLTSPSGAVVAATYHSDCGGRTDEPGTVWGGTSRVGTAVDRGCSISSRNTWRLVGTPQELTEKLVAKRVLPMGFKLAALSVGERSSGGRAILIEARSASGDKRRFTGERLREALGYGQMKSTMFEIGLIENPSGRQIEFKGRGFGHGSGLCQWGTRSLAIQGKSYREILQHYYPLLILKTSSDGERQSLTPSGSIASP